ncbi:MAG: glycosyltransferase family 2 protein [Burkholderiales bacterium]|jgi:glycosyltransferase involved in cell wall biosynthesis|nr:glycosyltransferase family 2 protein [Burkholderiales bacterium]
MSSQISIVINVKNGEHTIAKCLSALHRFTDVVVFDNYSTDKTVTIAKAYPNVNLIQHEFCGMGKVRNLAAGHAKYDWVFFVDCDEVVHPDLVDTLLSTNFCAGTIYLIKRKNYYANYLVDSSSWENDWIKRLFNRNDTRFAPNEVHDSFEVTDKIKYKKISPGFLYHFPYTKVSGLIDKMQFYSTLYAKQHFNKKHPSLWVIPFRAFFMFIKCYILKRGFLDGFAGFAISSYNAMGVFSKYIKLYELYNNYTLALAVKIDRVEELVNLAKNINYQNLLPEFVYVMSGTDLAGKYSDDLESHINNLCVLKKVMPAISINDWKMQTENTLALDYLVYIEDSSLLTDKDLLKRCKSSITGKKKISDKIRIIDLR